MEIWTPEEPSAEEVEQVNRTELFKSTVLGALDRGEITEQQAHDYYVVERLKNGQIDHLDKDDMLRAMDLGLVDDNTAEQWYQRKTSPVLYQLKNVGKGAIAGAMNYAQDKIEFLNPLLGWMESAQNIEDPGSVELPHKWEGWDQSRLTEEDFKAMDEMKPEVHTSLGVLAEMGSELALNYYTGPAQIVKKLRMAAPMVKLATSSKAGSYAYNFILGNIGFWGAEQMTFDPNEARFSDWIDDQWKNPITSYLKSDPEDSAAEGRFKMFVESVLIDGFLEGVTFPFLKAMNVYRKRLQNAVGGDKLKVSKKVDEVMQQEKALLEKGDVVPSKPPADMDELMAKELGDAPKRKVEIPDMDKTELAKRLLNVGENAFDPKNVDDLLHNMGKFETTDDVLEVIDMMAKHATESGDNIKYSRGKQTWKKSEKNMKATKTRIQKKAVHIAEQTGSNPHEVYSGIMRNEMAKTAEGLRQLEVKMMMYEEFMLRMDEILTHAAKTAQTDVDFLRVKELMNFTYELHGLSHGISAEIGRALQFRRRMKQADRFDFNTVKPEWIEEAMAAEGSKLRKVVKQFNQFKKGDRKAKAAFLKSTMKRKWWQHAVELRQAALVSGWRTQVRNILGNALSNGFETASVFLGMTGRSIAKGDLAHMRKFTHLMKGYGTGFITAMRLGGIPWEDLGKMDFKNFWKSVKGEAAKEMDSSIGTFWQSLFTGKPVTDSLTKQDTLGMVQSKPMAALKLSFHPLTAADEFFKSVAFHGRAQYEIASEVFDEVYASGRAANMTQKEMGAALKEKTSLHLKDLPDHIIDKAVKFSREVTFTQSLAGSGWGHINSWLNSSPIGGAIKFAFVPFFSVNANILRFAAYRTPVGAFKKTWRDTLLGKNGKDMQAELIGKTLLSSALIYWVTDKVSKWEITGTAPPGQRNAWANAKVQENSIWDSKNHRWVSYQNFEPFNTIISMTCDAYRLNEYYHMEDMDVWELAGNVFQMFAENLGNKTFMKGFGDLVDFAFQPEQRDLQKMFVDLAATSVPYSMLNQQLREGGDDLIRDTRRMIDIYYRNMDTKKMLPKRHAIYGSPREKEARLFGVFNAATESTDPLLAAMFMCGADVGMPRRKRQVMNDITKVTESYDFNKDPEGYDEYMQTIEKVWDLGVRQALTDFVQSPAWTQNRNDKYKAAWLKQMVSKVRSAAFQLWKSDRMDLIDQKVGEIIGAVGSFTGEGAVPNEMTQTYHLENRE